MDVGVYVGNDVVELVIAVPETAKARVLKRDGTIVQRFTAKTPHLFSDTGVTRGTEYRSNICDINEGWFGEEVEWCEYPSGWVFVGHVQGELQYDVTAANLPTDNVFVQRRSERRRHRRRGYSSPRQRSEP